MFETRCFRSVLLVILFSLSTLLRANAQTNVTWSGGGVTNIWGDPKNWNGGKIPFNTSENRFTATIDGNGGNSAFVLLDTLINLDGLTIDAGDSLGWAGGQGQLTIHANGGIAGRLENNGTIDLDGVRVGGSLVFDGGNSNSATLDGTGMIQMGHVATRIKASTPGTRLQHGTNHTINGYGAVEMLIDNDGTIVADILEQTLSIGDPNPANGSSINRGTLTAIDGGTLKIVGEWDNQKKIIRSGPSGTIAFTFGSRVIGGDIVSGENGGDIDLTGVTLVGGVFRSGIQEIRVSLEGKASETNGFNIEGEVRINGRFNIRPSGPVFGASLLLSNTDANPDVSLGNFYLGLAEIILFDEGITSIEDPKSLGNLKTDRYMSIGGTGVIGRGTINIDNEGSFVACFKDKKLFIQPRERFRNSGKLAADVCDNSLTLNPVEGTAPGILVLMAGEYDNTWHPPSSDRKDGEIEAHGDSGRVEFWHGVRVIGGSLNVPEPGGQFIFSQGVAELDTVQLRGNNLTKDAADVIVGRTATMALRTLISNAGVIEVRGIGSPFQQAAIEIRGNVKLNWSPNINDGWNTRAAPGIMLTHPEGSIIHGATGEEILENDLYHIIRGTGKIQELIFKNRGIVIADQLTPLIIDVGNEQAFFNEGQGKLIALGEGGIVIEPGNMEHNGLIFVRSPSSLTRNGGDFVTSGKKSEFSHDSDTIGTTELDTGKLIVNGGDVIVTKFGLLKGDGTIEGQRPGSGGFIPAGLVNSGTVRPMGKVLQEGFSLGISMNGDFKQMPEGILEIRANPNVNSQINCRKAELAGTLSFFDTSTDLELGDVFTLVECLEVRTGTFEEERIVFLNLPPSLQFQLNYNAKSVEIELVANPNGVGGQTYNQWRALQPFENEIDGEPTADPDKDGVRNDLERALLGDPLANNGSLIDIKVVDVDGLRKVEIKHKRPAGENAPTDVFYRYRTSTNMKDWSIMPIFSIDIHSSMETPNFEEITLLGDYEGDGPYDPSVRPSESSFFVLNSNRSLFFQVESFGTAEDL